LEILLSFLTRWSSSTKVVHKWCHQKPVISTIYEIIDILHNHIWFKTFESSRTKHEQRASKLHSVPRIVALITMHVNGGAGSNTGTRMCLCLFLCSSSCILMFLFQFFLNKFLHVKNWVYQWNIENIIELIFLTMKATILDTHGLNYISPQKIILNRIQMRKNKK